MAGAVRQLTCDARVVMMRVDSDAKRGVASSTVPSRKVREFHSQSVWGKVRSVPNSFSC